jgi:hypothetical protein
LKVAPGNPVSILAMRMPVASARGSSPEAHTQCLAASSSQWVALTFDGDVGDVVSQVSLLNVEVDHWQLVLVLSTQVISTQLPTRRKSKARRKSKVNADGKAKVKQP